MPSIEIVPVTTRQLRQAFLELPWQLYRGDPHWIPPLRGNQRELAGFRCPPFRHHPFYNHAVIQTFIARRGGIVCGRIGAIVNHAHNQRHNERRGFFGFFETIDEPEVAQKLLEVAWEWLAERGMDSMRGPVQPSLNYECGLLVEGFDSSPFFMMTYNRPFYGQLLENFGLRKSHDLLAFWGHVDMISQLSEKHAFIHRQVIERFGIEVRPMNTRRFRAEVAMFMDIYNRSLRGTWGFVPLRPAEADKLARGLQHLIVPELTRVAEVDGRPIGVLLGLLDYNGRIREIDGRLLPWGFFKLLRNRRAIKRMRWISANVMPEYQGWGVGLMLAREMLDPVLELGIEEVEFSWVLESNMLSRKSLEKGGAKLYKRYRIYDWSPEPRKSRESSTTFTVQSRLAARKLFWYLAF